MRLAPIALFLAVGLVLTAPLARHFGAGVPYTRHAPGAEAVRANVAGDHLQLYYRLWLFGDTLLGSSKPFRNQYEFSTAPGHEHPLAAYFLPFSLVFLVFSPLGPAAGYNAALLAAIALSGLAMRALVLHYTRDRAAALVAGTAYAAAPYLVLSVLGGHPIGLAAFLVPLIVLLVERLLAAPSPRAGLAAGGAAALLVDNDLHALYFVALLVPLFVVRHFAGVPPRGWRAAIRALLLPALLAATIAGAALAFKLSLFPPSDALGGPTRSLREVVLYAPKPADLLNRGGDSLPAYVYPGAAISAVALSGLAACLFRRRSPAGAPTPRQALFFALVGALSLLLAFGPASVLGGAYRLLHEHLPKFSLLRQSSKLMLPACFALAVLAGLGWAALRRALPGRRGTIAASIVVAAIVADASPFPGPGVGISLLPARVEAYERVFRDRPGSRVVNVPIWPGNDAWTSHYLYYATRYRTVMVNGYHPVVPAGYEGQVFRPLASLNAGQVHERQYELLRRLGVEYLVFHEESFPPKVSQFPSQYSLENLLSSPRLEPVSLAPPVAIFRVRPPGEIAAGEQRPVSTPVGVALPAWRSGEGPSRPDADAASGTVLVAGAGTARLQRPRTTPAGRFTLAVRLRPEEGVAAGAIAVVRAADGALLAERAFSEAGPGYRTLEMEFALDEAAQVSYELRNAGGAVAVDWLYLRFADQQDPLRAVELEELFHTGNAAAAPLASGGRALQLTAADPAGQATRGPYRLYGAGRYRLSLSLARADAGPLPPETVVASVALRNHLDEVGAARDLPENVLMPERAVTAAALGGAGVFRELAFPFELARPAFVSLHLRHFQHGLLADRASVARVDP